MAEERSDADQILDAVRDPTVSDGLGWQSGRRGG